MVPIVSLKRSCAVVFRWSRFHENEDATAASRQTVALNGITAGSYKSRGTTVTLLMCPAVPRNRSLLRLQQVFDRAEAVTCGRLHQRAVSFEEAQEADLIAFRERLVSVRNRIPPTSLNLYLLRSPNRTVLFPVATLSLMA